MHGEKRAKDEAVVLESARSGEDSPGSRKAPAAAQAGSAAVSPQPSPSSQQATPPVAQGRPPPEFRGPDITLIAGEERTVYEYRQNGQLRMIKVVPKFGKPYYLAPRDPTRGWGDLEQADSLIAQWVLWEF